MNEVMQAGGSALAIRRDQSDWTPDQGQALLEMFNLGSAPHAVLRSYFHVCQTTGLDPFKRQIHLIERQGKFTPQTSIDGFRIIRDRSGAYDGDETFWCGDDGQWTDAWLRDEPPTACKFTLYVKGRSHPVTAVARWSEYVQTKRDGTVTSMWKRMAAHMLAKVAEALAIRKAFPDDTGGLYTDDEMMQAEVVDSGRGGRQRSPGLMDLDVPPERQQQPEQPSAPVGGGFMDAPTADDNVEDAVIVPDDEPAEEQAAAPAAAAEQPAPEQQQPVDQESGAQQPTAPMDMQPEQREQPPRIWSTRLAEFCELENPQLHDLRAMYDAASADGALGDGVPWIGVERGGMPFGDAVMAVRFNLESGKHALDGLQA